MGQDPTHFSQRCFSVSVFALWQTKGPIVIEFVTMNLREEDKILELSFKTNDRKRLVDMT